MARTEQLTPWQKLLRSWALGRGIRLTREEVSELCEIDDAIGQAVLLSFNKDPLSDLHDGGPKTAWRNRNEKET